MVDGKTVLERFSKAQESADIVSFDFFDTLVTREETFVPKDIFHFVDQQIRAELSIEIPRFAEFRIRAESLARKHAWAKGISEVTLDEIYEELAALVGIDANPARKILKIELACEQARISASEIGKKLFEVSKSGGKQIVITTDTYFSQKFIRQIAAKAGYRGISEYFVSSELGKTKADGSLFRHVIATLDRPPSAILHVGDNLLTDCRMPLDMGIRSMHLPLKRSLFMSKMGISDPVSGNIVTSNLMRQITSQFDMCTASARQDVVESTSHAMALLYYNFACWIFETASQQEIDRVYFAARDGLIIKRFFDLIAKGRHADIQSDYLYVSRAGVYPSLIYTDETAAKDIYLHSWGRLTLQQAIKRLSLKIADCQDVLASQNLDVDRVLHQSVADIDFPKLLEDLWPLVIRKNRKKFRLVHDYLASRKLFDPGKCAFVDIGWHGSLQRSIAKIISHEGYETQLTGLYLGTFADTNNANNGIDYEGYLVSGGSPRDLLSLVQAGPSVIELLMTAGHGSVTGYRQGKHGIEPVLDSAKSEIRQFDSFAGLVQQRAFEIVEEQLRSNPGFAASPADPDLVARIALRPIYEPTIFEAERMGKLKIATDFGGHLKSVTGLAEWKLAEIKGETLPDGKLPMWRAGFKILKNAGA